VSEQLSCAHIIWNNNIYFIALDCQLYLQPQK
jgi:hypothetical protein